MLPAADALPLALTQASGLASTLVAALPYPEFDPVAVSIPFPLFGLERLDIRWYSLAYIVGLIAGWRLAIWLSRQPGSAFDEDQANEFPTWILFGLMLGGRFGYVLFYKPRYYFGEAQWWEMFAVWQGGMSFHGGLLGILIATVLFSRKHRIPVPAMTDLVVLVAPIGLFLGRLANFVNGELWGRPTDHWIGMVFPRSDGLSRHPSQLYEAALEGVALFTVLWILRAKIARRWHHGLLSGCFLVGYGVFRSTAELFRQPDAHLGFIAANLTMGQLLSFPMVVAGGVWIYLVVSRGPVDAATASEGEGETTTPTTDEAAVEAPDDDAKGD